MLRLWCVSTGEVVVTTSGAALCDNAGAQKVEKELLNLQPRMEQNQGNNAIIALIYKSIAEALQYTGELENALINVEIGLAKSQEVKYGEGILFCMATKAEILFKMGQIHEAAILARDSLEMMEKESISAIEIENDMKKLLASIRY